MTYKQRRISLQFSDSKGTLSLQGLRCNAIIQNPGGFSSYGMLELRAFGMSLEQMNQFSSVGMNGVRSEQRTVLVSAGDVDGVVTQVFEGSLIRSFIDFAGAPDACFVCAAVAGFYEKAKATAPNSYKGAQNAEDMIRAIAVAAGFKFQNNGAHAVLQNQYVSGSAVDQMQTVARAAAFPLVIENGTVYIWPNDKERDGVVIELGPKTGMVGYPTYWEAGFVVKSEFNPLIANGRTVKLTSSIPKANGSWVSQNVTHELSTLSPDGPWFTTARLASGTYVPAN